MNKQQLAAKIWESANKMRSKIEANEYKDYILGFIFYKYLSDKLVRFAKDEGFTEAELRELPEDDTERRFVGQARCQVFLKVGVRAQIKLLSVSMGMSLMS